MLMQLEPKEENINNKVNPFGFFLRLVVGNMAIIYFSLVPIYMWIKDRIVPDGMPL